MTKTHEGRRVQFSLGFLLQLSLLAACILSGAIWHPISLALVLLGFILIRGSLQNATRPLPLGVCAGVGYVVVAAVIGILLSFS